MLCCIGLTAMIAIAVWIKQNILLRSHSGAGNPLTWRLQDRAAEETEREPAVPFSMSARLQSFGFAINGMRFVVATQHNAWIHMTATVAVVLAAMALGISAQDWLWLFIAMALVWTAETFNTALELLCDVVSPAHNPSIGKVKDIAAGAVLICAVAAIIIGALVLGPYAMKVVQAGGLDLSFCRAAL
jgi:diacylglycerol kinase (ATP)